MAALNWSSQRMLRSPVSLRRLFVWILLTLLLTGAASYTHASRNAIVPVPPQAVPAASTAHSSMTAPQSTGTVDCAAPHGTEETEMDCCQRRHAPRGEPAPMRTGVLHPPSATEHQPGERVLNGAVPPEPDLPALTVIELSISRT